MIKLNTKKEYAEYLRSLVVDWVETESTMPTVREVELEQWKFRLIKSVLTSRSNGRATARR